MHKHTGRATARRALTGTAGQPATRRSLDNRAPTRRSVLMSTEVRVPPRPCRQGRSACSGPKPWTHALVTRAQSRRCASTRHRPGTRIPHPRDTAVLRRSRGRWHAGTGSRGALDSARPARRPGRSGRAAGAAASAWRAWSRSCRRR